MSALNKPNTAVSLGTKKVNFEGNVQDVKPAHQQLYELAVMSLYGKDSFYESGDTMLDRFEQHVQAVVKANDFDFIANVIIHARTAMNIRTMPIVLTCLFAKALRDQNKTYDKMRQVTCDVIQRADQITDMYACALNTFGANVDVNLRKRTIPMAIKRGIADAFNKFNEYQIGKYNRKGAVKLRDVLWVVHPKAKSIEQGELFQKIMEERVEIPYTWETELTKNGSLPADERKSPATIWGELVDSGKLGYMALLRNLRNILQADVDNSIIKTVCTRLESVDQVLNSKQLPFRFVNALDSIAEIDTANVSKVNRSLSRALDISLQNIPKLGNNTWIIIDCSLSMTGHTVYNSRGNVGPVPLKTAALFASALFKANADANNIALTLFSDDAVNVKNLNGDDSILTTTKSLLKQAKGGGTNLDAALNKKSTLGFEPDTVIILSDMQVNRLRASDVSKLFTSDCIKIAINLAPYETTPVGEMNGWIQLSGWSEKLFDFIPALRNKMNVIKLLQGPYAGIFSKPANNIEE